MNRSAWLLAGTLCLLSAGAPAALAQDADAVLRSARSAIMSARNITFSARYEGTGLLASTPVATAEVVTARSSMGSPVQARLSVFGKSIPTGTQESQPFHMVFDGLKVKYINTEGAVVSVDPGDDQQALLAREELRLIPYEMLIDQPLTLQIDTGRLTTIGREDVAGVPCDVVMVEYVPRSIAGAPAPGRVKERWAIARDDHLPRRIERLATVIDPQGGEPPESATVLTLASVRTNERLDVGTFRITSVSPDKPARPDGLTPPPPLRPRTSLLSVNSFAPDWILKDEKGAKHQLAQYRGRVVVLDFWATWCGPCKKVMPEVQALHDKFKGRDVDVIGIATFERGDPAAYMRAQNYTYGLFLNGDDVAAAYGVRGIPTIYVIGADGRVLFRTTGVGSNDMARIEKIIEQQTGRR